MIRRLKKDVLSELPDKIRSKVHIEADSSIVTKIQKQLNVFENVEQSINNAFNDDNCDQIQVAPILIQCYKMSGMAKLDGIKSYVSDLLENGIKFLLFCHH